MAPIRARLVGAQIQDNLVLYGRDLDPMDLLSLSPKSKIAHLISSYFHGEWSGSHQWIGQVKRM